NDLGLSHVLLLSLLAAAPLCGFIIPCVTLKHKRYPQNLLLNICNIPYPPRSRESRMTLVTPSSTHKMKQVHLLDTYYVMPYLVRVQEASTRIIRKTPRWHPLLNISRTPKRVRLHSRPMMFSSALVTPLGNTYQGGSHVGTAGWSTIQMPKQNL